MGARCVIFDIGGVLEITPATGWTEQWEKRLGLPPGAVDERLGEVWAAGEIGAVGEDEVRGRISGALGLDAVQVDAFLADLWEEYLGSANAELISYVRGLRSRCTLGILSNSFVGARELEEKLYHFGDLVQEVVYSHEIGVRKPEARAFTVACSRLGVAPESCLFVDDLAVNVEAAQALGMRGLLFEDNARTVAGIEDHLTGRT
ncbi:HAD family hydrolase [Streptomyces nanshensis]|uniref:Hydrolase n=1 Tax=Streptomyces nanshensis TaxID=518642 RepID=A0A1E7KXW8_9ACTN|nr:HAD family phosphatase [Streptomyces nanshensis]OEV08744.1 hydrolase [Streptomyces nanshensis]